MIVNRRVFIAKKGRLMEAAQFCKAEAARIWPSTVRWRVCTSNLGPFDAFAAEAEF